MLNSKFVGYFLAEVTEWREKLTTADQVRQPRSADFLSSIFLHLVVSYKVIGLWFEAQYKWSYLESIFIGSEDIRNQLPEDSKRFDAIDEDFRV